MRRVNYKVVFLLVIFCLFSGLTVQAGVKDIKARMKARLPEINQLKSKGVVGETSDGYLGFVGKSHVKDVMVTAENADRKKVYGAIAKQQGATVKVVGTRRALQISKKAKPGTWLQDNSGKWHKK